MNMTDAGLPALPLPPAGPAPHALQAPQQPVQPVQLPIHQNQPIPAQTIQHGAQLNWSPFKSDFLQKP